MGEFATLLQGGAIVELLPLRQLAATAVEPSPAPTDEEGAKADGGMEAAINGQAHEARYAAAPPSRLLEAQNNPGLEDGGARPQENIEVPDPQRQLAAHAGAMEGYHAEAVKLMNANVNATVDYAWRLAEVRSPAEFIALSTKHACRHFELIMMHAAAFDISSLSWPAAPNSRDDKMG
jgi:hypothetical protein